MLTVFFFVAEHIAKKIDYFSEYQVFD